MDHVAETGPRRMGLDYSRWKFCRGYSPDTTNQRMELLAVIEAVTTVQGPLEIISDSTYVVNCFRDSWWEGWLQRNWKNSQRKPVANRDLWEPLIAQYQDRDLMFTWVKATEEMNGMITLTALRLKLDSFKQTARVKSHLQNYLAVIIRANKILS